MKLNNETRWGIDDQLSRNGIYRFSQSNIEDDFSNVKQFWSHVALESSECGKTNHKWIVLMKCRKLTSQMWQFASNEDSHSIYIQ